MYAAVLMTADSTIKEESAGLIAHMFNVSEGFGWQSVAELR